MWILGLCKYFIWPIFTIGIVQKWNLAYFDFTFVTVRVTVTVHTVAEKCDNLSQKSATVAEFGD